MKSSTRSVSPIFGSLLVWWLLHFAAACSPEDEGNVDIVRSEVASSWVHMQIVAHQDDDFLFMNPDLGNSIEAGHTIVTVFLTAGQASGAPGMCAAEFAASRQLGIKAAYAQMAFPNYPYPASLPWSRDFMVPDAGVTWPHTVERFTLLADPRIQLIFMNIPDAGSQIGPCNHEPYANALGDMFEDPNYVSDTIVPDCGLNEGYENSWMNCQCSLCNGEDWYPNPFVCDVFQGCAPSVPWQNYDHAGVVAVLTGLINAYQPIVIRTLDPQPFAIENQIDYDNPDHIAAARFTDKVIANYHGPYGTGRHTVIHYKGYGFTSYPRNLGGADGIEKRNTAYVYKNYDPNYQTYYLGYEHWYYLMYDRYPASTNWLERTNHGRLVAATVEDREVKIWVEDTVGGTWTGPTSLGGGGPIAPHVTLVKRPDGKLQIFALRLPLEREQWGLTFGPPYQEVITAIQSGGNKIAFGSWQSAGCGQAPCYPDNRQFVGVPTAAFDGSGRTYVFAKNSDGHISYAYKSGNNWSGWLLLSSSAEDIIDGIAAIPRDDGVIEVFATGRSGQIHHYRQEGTSFAYDSSFPFADAASAPTVTKNQDGRLEIFYREAQRFDPTDPWSGGRVLTAWQDTTGQWVGPANLYGDAGVGPAAAIRRGGTGHIMLFERNAWAGISMTLQQAPNDIFLTQWQVLSQPLPGELRFVEYPAATTDNVGRVVVIAKGTDGRLYMRRETSAGAIASFGGWTQVGS